MAKILKQLLCSSILCALSMAGYLAHASTIVTDAITVATVGGQETPANIFFSSAIYITTGSSMTLSGPNGYIVTNSSVTGSSFFGDGSHISGIPFGLLSTTNTFTGGVTFSSSFTVQTFGRAIVISTSAQVNNIQISPDGATSFYPPIHNSSSTIVPTYSTTRTTLDVCVPGSTLTVTTAGGMVEIIFTGWVQIIGVAGDFAFASILQDGTYVGELSNSKGILRGSAVSYNQAFVYKTSPPAGLHSYCLTVASSNSSRTARLTTTSATNSFYINELR